MTESTPPEGQWPLTQGQIRQLHRSLQEKVLDKAASDPEWKELLLGDPDLAIREANFPEAQQLEQQGRPWRSREREVVGHRPTRYGYDSPWGPYCRWHWSPIDKFYQTYNLAEMYRAGAIPIQVP